MPPAACTSACTGIPEEGNGGALDAGQDGSTLAASDRPDDAAGRGPSPDDSHQGAAGEGIERGNGARESSTAGAPTDQGDPLAKLAAALLTLSPADRERLAGMLAGHQCEGEGGGA